MRFDDERPNGDQSTSDEFAQARLRSHKFVQIVFCGFTLLFAALAVTAHHSPEWLAIAEAEPRRIADTFLVLAAAYALCLFVWERIYPTDD